MVLDPPKKQVNVTRMIIYSLIPYLGIYAAWRIQKFWVLFGIDFAVGIVIGVLLPWWLSLIAQVPITVFVVRHYARRYNEKIVDSEVQDPVS